MMVLIPGLLIKTRALSQVAVSLLEHASTVARSIGTVKAEISLIM